MSNENPIPTAEKVKMQQVAASPEKVRIETQPGAEVTEAKPADAKVLTKTENAQVSLNKLSVGVIITLDLTNFERFEENNATFKSILEKVEIEGHENSNLFNPFRPVNKKVKAKDPEAARGLLRNAMSSVFNIAAELEGQNVVYLGKRSDQVALMRKLAVELQNRVQTALGLPADHAFLLADAEDPNPSQPLLFSDLIRVTSWANTDSAALNMAADADAGITSNVFVNLTVNAGSLYAAGELDNAVGQVINYLEQVAAKFEEDAGYAPLVIFGVALRGNSLADGKFVDLLNNLNERESFDLYDRHDLVQAAQKSSADWVPPSKSGVEELLLPKHGDMFLMSILPEEDSGEEEGEE